MRINGRSEYSNFGKAEWIPIISSFIGVGRLIHSIYRAVFSPKVPQNQNDQANFAGLKGRVQLWSEEKRGAIALIPIIGNVLIYQHDSQVHKEFNQLEDRLLNASKSETEQVFLTFPEEVRNSESIILDFVKENPEILKYSDFSNDQAFMTKVAIQKIENLKYAPLVMMEDRVFILYIVNKTDLDLFALFPQLIETYRDDPEVMVQMAIRNLSNLQYATALMNNEKFVLSTASEIYHDSFYSRASLSQPQKVERPHYMRFLPILDYAPELCRNADFMLQAKLQPYLNPIEYAKPHFADNQDFILAMMKDYRMTGGWVFSSCGNGITFGVRDQTLPLEIASMELRNNVEFIQKAMEIDPDALKIASDEAKYKILPDPSKKHYLI